VPFALRDLENPLVKSGLAAQLARRRALIGAGGRPLGWKIGLGSPALMHRLGTAAPMIGFLMQRALVLSGSTISLNGWAAPVAEPELCVRMASDLGGGATPEQAAGAIKEILPAIELVDFDPPPTPDNLGTVLEGDVYQRHVVLCGNTRPGASVAGLTSRVTRRGAEFARTSNPEELTGRLDDLVAHVANMLAALGERLRAGEVLITGSITPAITIEPDETEIAHAVDPIGEVSVGFSRD